MVYITDGTINYWNYVGSGVAWTGTLSNTPYAIQTNNAERMRIDSSGNVLIGASSYGGPYFDPGSLYANSNISIGNSSGNSSYYFRFDGFSNSLYALWNSGSGDVGVKLDYGATSWASVSDEESKDIIEPINNAVQKILTLRTVIGKYKTDEIGTRRPFLIAQDVKAVLPEVVSESIAPNQTKSNLWLSYQDTIPLIIAGIKELSAQVTQQQSTITQLQADVAALKTKVGI
jgi:hypothetical protein